MLFLNYIPLVMVLITTRTLAINVAEFTDEELLFKFKETKVLSEDCDPKSTEEAIKFLSMPPEKMDSLEDDALRLINITKFRRFIKKKGFLTTPGSLHFINGLDTTLNLKCGEVDGAWWKVIGTHNDNLFNDEGKTGHDLQTTAPPFHRYFQRYWCSKPGGGPKGCQHQFYVINRPLPRTKFPVSGIIGEEIDFYCRIHACIRTDNQLIHGCRSKMEPPPQPQKPYNIYWTIPGNDEFHFRPEPTDDDNNVVQKEVEVEDDIRTFIKWKVENSTEGREPSVGSSTILLPNATKAQSGRYVCIIEDANGVVSIPSEGSLKNEKDPGQIDVHIRPIWAPLIPGGATLVLCLIVVILILVCPERVDRDEQGPLEKETPHHEIQPTSQTKSTTTSALSAADAERKNV